MAKRHDHGLPPNTASRQKLGGPASEKLYFRLLRVQVEGSGTWVLERVIIRGLTIPAAIGIFSQHKYSDYD